MPTAAAIDDDHALHERARLVQQDALGQQVAGGVAADVTGVRGQVEQLVLAAEHDLDLLHGAPIALEAVVDAAADQPRAELGERPLERWRPRRSPRGDAGTRRSSAAAPGGSRPRACASRPRVTSSVLGEQRLAGVVRGSTPEAPSSSTIVASAPSPSVMIVSCRSAPDPRRRRTSAARSAAPGARRPGRGGGRPGSRSRGRARPACRQPGSPAPPSSSRAEAIRVTRERGAESSRGSRRRRPPRAPGPGRPRHPREGRPARQRRRAAGPRRAALGAAGGSDVRPGVRQVGVAQIEVGRVQLVRLDRERLERRPGRDPLGAEPVGLGAFGRRAPRRAPGRRR